MNLAVKNEESAVKEFYINLKNYEFDKKYKAKALLETLEKNGMIDKEKIEEKINEMRNEFRISSSNIKSEIIELKRFIIENSNTKSEINITEEILKDYQEDRVDLW